jgi:hypothetical protein
LEDRSTTPENHEQVTNIDSIVVHISKNNADLIHKSWLDTLADGTLVIYTDGSRSEGGLTGAGWIITEVQNHELKTSVTEHCHLGNRMEVFDAVDEVRGISTARTPAPLQRPRPGIETGN